MGRDDEAEVFGIVYADCSMYRVLKSTAKVFEHILQGRHIGVELGTRSTIPRR